MAILMLLILLILITIAYFFGKRDLLSPWFLLCLIILLSFTIVLANYSNWEIEIHGIFVVYVTTAVLSFGAGAAIVKVLSSGKIARINKTEKLSIYDSAVKKSYPVNVFLIISVALSVVYIGKLLSDAGSAGSFSEKLRKIYDSIVNDNYSPGFIFNQMREIIVAIAYLNSYRLFIKIFWGKKDRINLFKLVIPVVMLIAITLVTSDRNIFLRYAIYFVCLYVMFFYENCRQKNANSKIAARVAIIAVLAFLIFFVFGKLKQYNSDIERVIGIYGGSGLYRFNLWLNDFNGTLTYGSSTFSTFLNSVKTIFQYVGIDLSNIETVDRFDKFITFTSSNGYIYSSNIYSALKPFVQDFGYFGVILFPLITGCFYQWLYYKMKAGKYNFAWVVYGMLIYPVIFYPILDQLFGRFNLGFVYEFVWLSLLYYFVFGRNKVRVLGVVPEKRNG